jgi:hypothetical protein
MVNIKKENDKYLFDLSTKLGSKGLINQKRDMYLCWKEKQKTPCLTCHFRFSQKKRERRKACESFFIIRKMIYEHLPCIVHKNNKEDVQVEEVLTFFLRQERATTTAYSRREIQNTGYQWFPARKESKEKENQVVPFVPPMLADDSRVNVLEIYIYR